MESDSETIGEKILADKCGAGFTVRITRREREMNE
jgi:hypothetical protein